MGRLRLRPGSVAWREVEGEAVVLDLQRSRYLAVNPSGTVLWRRLEAGATREELVEELARAYGLARPAAEGDVDRFLQVLGSHGLLEEDPEP